MTERSMHRFRNIDYTVSLNNSATQYMDYYGVLKSKFSIFRSIVPLFVQARYIAKVFLHLAHSVRCKFSLHPGSISAQLASRN